MTIKVGDRVPAVSLKRIGADGMEDVDTGAYFAGRKIVMFAVPGAFTPTCSARHLPGFVENADAIKAKGIDEIVCMAVNDPFVMKAWLAESGAEGAVSALPDGNGEFTRALGLTMDGSGHGLGERSKRFALVAEDGIVTALAVEPAGGVDVSGAEKILQQL